jgi:hypothetical protein
MCTPRESPNAAATTSSLLPQQDRLQATGVTVPIHPGLRVHGCLYVLAWGVWVVKLLSYTNLCHSTPEHDLSSAT